MIIIKGETSEAAYVHLQNCEEIQECSWNHSCTQDQPLAEQTSPLFPWSIITVLSDWD